ncbi:CerR family C-terminal domain-containing protein [Sphingomonas sp. PAMC 26605]|uniref:CerR family C-terminal domain-containing protein n=1 Tax=Sphingomonas sp. PAMC 26605 TaxID=1112214 RepID=UPI00026CDD69|nr:CerR family C-terminal domain-containing protein [Sphingomonas sp. PAMC 26605]
MLQQRLLEIAIAEFATKGLEGASTRSIAAKAGTAMSSITYHFGGKEGLYLAAADYIATQMGDDVANAVPPEGIPAGITPQQARAMLHDLLARFIEKMAGERSAAYSLFIMREQMEPTEAFERIYGGMMGKMLGVLVELICTATGWRDATTAQVTAITLMGQIVVLRVSRATVLKLLQRSDIDAAATTLLTRRIAANTDAILDQLIAERQELP